CGEIPSRKNRSLLQVLTCHGFRKVAMMHQTICFYTIKNIQATVLIVYDMGDSVIDICLRFEKRYVGIPLSGLFSKKCCPVYLVCGIEDVFPRWNHAFRYLELQVIQCCLLVCRERIIGLDLVNDIRKADVECECC